MNWFKRTEKPVPATPPAAPASPKASHPAWDVTVLTSYIQSQAPQWEQRSVEAALVEARLGDRMRDELLSPLPSGQFAQLVSSLDANGWRRLALATGAFDLPVIRCVLPALAAIHVLPQHAYGGLVRLAAGTDVLPLALLGQSEVRAEEFARHFAAHLCVAILGEKPELSQAILQRLDYRRLLAEAERARGSAEEQLEYLRKLQAAQDQGRRRGKW